MSVFVVQHVHTHDDGLEDVKLIGIYSTRENATAAVNRLASQPGFCDAIDGFHIGEHRIDDTNWAEGYVDLSNAEPGD